MAERPSPHTEKQQAQPMTNEISIPQSGTLIDPGIMQQARTLADTLGKTNMVPKQYIGKPDDIFIAILMGAQLGLNPFTALQGIATINGTPSLWGDVQLAVCRSHPQWGGMVEMIENEKDANGGWVAVCTVTRKASRLHTSVVSQWMMHSGPG